jgi:restriction endonuclease
LKFKFKIQQYQTEAVNSVVNIFAGQIYRYLLKNDYIDDNDNISEPN